MSYKTVIGVDVGETVGILRLEYERLGLLWAPVGTPVAIQCNASSMMGVVLWLAADRDVIIAHERYVVNLRASKSKKAAASQTSRDLNGQLAGLDRTNLPKMRIRVVEHTAAEVKTWATAPRLAAAGLVYPSEQRHATDGGRHALYCATNDLGAPDPLSRSSRAQPTSGGTVAAAIQQAGS